MAKSDPGTKRGCPDCGIKFYDLNKRPVVCPKCAHSYNPDASIRAAKKRAPEPEVTPDAQDETSKDDDAQAPAGETGADIEGLDAEEEEAKALELDGDKPTIMSGSDGGDDGDADGETPDAAAALPEGFTEEGVEDDADALADNDDEEVDLDVDLDKS